jgi:uncharacterized protein (TIGR02145 family)
VSATRLPVTATVTPTPEITNQPAGTAICSGGTVKLTVAATNITAYQWKKGSSDVSDGDGGQSATYTTAALAANATYSVVVYNNACSTVSSNAVVTVHTASTAPTALDASTTTVCSGSPVTLTASGGTLGTSSSYQFGTGSETLTATTATTYTHSPTSSATYWVKIVTTLLCAAPGGSATRAITVYALPTITLASGSTAQTVTYGDAMTQIKYNTANASSATVAGLPTGVSGAWASNVYTSSGTPTSRGTSSYTVTTTNGNGCANAIATGNITVPLPAGCVPATLNLETIGFTSTQTYNRNGLTISSPVTATYCNRRTSSNFNGGSSGSYKADCATNYYSTAYGNWFSWCLVAQYGDQLCPPPWRVPTREDHCMLVNNSTTNCNTLGSTFNGVVGYAYTGYAISLSHNYGGSNGYYWSTTESSAANAYSLRFNGSNTYPQNLGAKYYGFALRCVR